MALIFTELQRLKRTLTLSNKNTGCYTPSLNIRRHCAQHERGGTDTIRHALQSTALLGLLPAILFGSCSTVGHSTQSALNGAARDLGGDHFYGNRPPSAKSLLGLECKGEASGSRVLIEELQPSQGLGKYELKYTDSASLLADFKDNLHGGESAMSFNASAGFENGLRVVIEGVTVESLPDSPSPDLASSVYRLDNTDIRGKGRELLVIKSQLRADKLSFDANDLSRAGMSLNANINNASDIKVGADGKNASIVSASGSKLVWAKECRRAEVTLEDAADLHGDRVDWGIYTVEGRDTPSAGITVTVTTLTGNAPQTIENVMPGQHLVIDRRDGSTVFVTLKSYEQAASGRTFTWSLARYSAKWLIGI